MGVICNLFLIPSNSVDNPPRPAHEIAAAMVTARMLRGPVMVGPTFRQDGRLVEPQAACGGWAGDAFAQTATRFEAPEDAIASLPSSAGSMIIAFTALDETHPSIAKDFDMYEGYECSIAAYSVAEGYRLRLTGEPDPDRNETEGETIFDGMLFEWIHIQGKAAPYTSIYEGSDLAAMVDRLWPGHQVVEIAYL